MAKYHNYYDLFNSNKKDYYAEVQRLKRIYLSLSNDSLNKVLEIGAGTGNHTRYLCDIADRVVACDIDPEMAKIAKKKLVGLPVDYYISGVDGIDDNEFNFPLCVMMWHVLNYFPNLDTIYHVFSEIKEKLKTNGIFIFDAWNGVAVIRDLPKHVKNEIKVGNLNLVHELRGSTDLMSQTTTILNHVEVYENQEFKDQFTHKIIHYIWTAKVITDILKSTGFELIKITKAGNYELEADYTDWKITYIARRKP